MTANNMKKIIVTPAGRQATLEILYQYLKKNKNEFDQWVLWINTRNKSDLAYIANLTKTENWIKFQVTEEKVDNNVIDTVKNIYNFVLTCNDPTAMYLRLDDDICFIEPGAITKIFNARQKNTDSLLVYGTILNNTYMQKNQQKYHIFTELPEIKDFNHDQTNAGQDPVLWKSGEYAEKIHRKFFEQYRCNNLKYFYTPDYYNSHDHISINVIALRGDLHYLLDTGNRFEEPYLAVEKPRQIGVPNYVVGDALFCHYSYFTQKEYLDNTDILQQYRDILTS